MNQGWEYKKLGDVSTIVGGSTPKTNIPTYWGGVYSWITPAELNGSKYIESTERHITDDAIAHTNLQLLPIGTVLLTSRAPIGKVAITKIPMYCNQGFKNIVPGESLFNEFVYWYLTYKKDYIISLGRGATFKEISKSITEQIPIPVPSIEEQKAICSLLDKLSRVIEAKKEQLKELDNLAQAIFYDMFGDPITNEKGWDIKTIKESCKRLYAGGDVPKESFCKKKNTDYTIPIFSNGIENNGLYGYTNDPKETENCITIAGRGTIGYCVIRREPFFPIIRLIVAVPKDEINVVYLKGVIDCLKLKGQGVAIPQLTIPMIKDKNIPVPPLPLQQSFAEKVEAIERQKELINQSIREVQTLFDSRMDYWFSD